MIACLGEHLSEREGGKTEEIVTQQMKAIAGMCVCVCGRGGEEGGRKGGREEGGDVRVCMRSG